MLIMFRVVAEEVTVAAEITARAITLAAVMAEVDTVEVAGEATRAGEIKVRPFYLKTLLLLLPPHSVISLSASSLGS